MPYDTVVIVREVRDTRDLAGPVLEGGAPRALPTRFETEDLNALEMALAVKDKSGGKVTALSVGQPGEVDVLRECLYRGADAAVRIDANPATLDAHAIAALLAAAIQKIGKTDLVVAGVTVADGETASAAALTAAKLDIELVTYVDALEQLDTGKLTCKRGIEMGYEYVEAPLPALLTVGVALLNDDPRTPRSAKAMLKLKAKKQEIPAWTPADLGVDVAAATRVERTGYTEVPERVIVSRDVPADNEPELKAMMAELRKGD